jgi:hypothetical protein
MKGLFDNTKQFNPLSITSRLRLAIAWRLQGVVKRSGEYHVPWGGEVYFTITPI